MRKSVVWLWRRRPAPALRLALAFASVFALGALASVMACDKSSPPMEKVESATLPPITVCYEPDGAPCPPPDAGDDAGEADAEGNVLRAADGSTDGAH